MGSPAGADRRTDILRRTTRCTNLRYGGMGAAARRGDGSEAEPAAWEPPLPKPEGPARNRRRNPLSPGPLNRPSRSRPRRKRLSNRRGRPGRWGGKRRRTSVPTPMIPCPSPYRPYKRAAAPRRSPHGTVRHDDAEALPVAPVAQPAPEAAEQPRRDDDDAAEEDDPPPRGALRPAPAQIAPGAPKELPEPVPVSTSEPDERPRKHRRSGVVRWIFAGVVVVALAGALYQSGLWTRLTRPATNEATLEGLATVAPTAEQITASAAATAEAAGTARACSRRFSRGEERRPYAGVHPANQRGRLRRSADVRKRRHVPDHRAQHPAGRGTQVDGIGGF